MGFFDKVDQGFADASDILQGSAAATQGKLQQYEATKQEMGIKNLAAMRMLTDEMETIALSAETNPEIIGPKLRQLQQVSKQIGVPISDAIIEHYTRNPLAFGMANDPKLTQGMTPQQSQQFKRLQLMAIKPGPRQLQAQERVDGILAGRFATSVMTSMREKVASGMAEDEAFTKSMSEQGDYASNPKYAAAAVEMIHKFNPGIREASELRKKTGEEQRRLQGDITLAQAKAKIERPSRGLQQRNTDLGDKVLQEVFDPDTGDIISSKSLPKGRVPKEEPTEKLLSIKEKQTLLAQKRGEARRLVEATIPRGIMGQQDLTALGDNLQERQGNFNKLVDDQLKALLLESGYSLEELTARQGLTPKPTALSGQTAPRMLGKLDATKLKGEISRNPRTGERRKSNGLVWEVLP